MRRIFGGDSPPCPLTLSTRVPVRVAFLRRVRRSPAYAGSPHSPCRRARAPRGHRPPGVLGRSLSTNGRNAAPFNRLGFYILFHLYSLFHLKNQSAKPKAPLPLTALPKARREHTVQGPKGNATTGPYPRPPSSGENKRPTSVQTQTKLFLSRAARFSVCLSVCLSLSAGDLHQSHQTVRLEGRRARRAGVDGVGVPGLNQDPICT